MGVHSLLILSLGSDLIQILVLCLVSGKDGPLFLHIRAETRQNEVSHALGKHSIVDTLLVADLLTSFDKSADSVHSLEQNDALDKLLELCEKHSLVPVHLQHVHQLVFGSLSHNGS